MVEDEVEPESSEATGVAAARASTQLVPCPPREKNQRLPKDPGVYLYSKDGCTGKCFRLDGFRGNLVTATGWAVLSAYVVIRGRFWAQKAPPDGAEPLREITNGPRKVTFANSPQAAEKF